MKTTVNSEWLSRVADGAANLENLPPAGRPAVRRCLVAMLCAMFLPGCSWLTPSHVVDVGTIVACVLAHDSEPVTQIAIDCGIEDQKQIVDILAAHKAAAKREAAACGP